MDSQAAPLVGIDELPYLDSRSAEPVHRFHRPRSHDILGFGGELTTPETGVGVGSRSRTATTKYASVTRRTRGVPTSARKRSVDCLRERGD